MKSRIHVRQPLALCLGAACCGILTDRFSNPNGLLWWGLLLLSLLVWSFLVRFVKNRPLLPTLFVLLGIYAAFGFWHHLYWNYYKSNDIGHYATTAPQPVCLRGVVCESAYYIAAPPVAIGQWMRPETRTVFILKVQEIRDGENWRPVAGRLSVIVEEQITLPRLGDSLELYGQLYAPSVLQNPNDFDLSVYWQTRRVLANLRVQSSDALLTLQSATMSPFRLLESVRRNAQQNLQYYLTEKASAFASATLLGFRENIDEEMNRTLLETGTMHILAISGLHISMITGSLFLLCRAFRLSVRQTVFLLVIFVVLYFFLTDRRPPAFRASLLVLFVCCGLFFNRHRLAINTFCATALVILICNPSDLFQFGTQLSFLATSVFLWIPRYETLVPVKKNSFIETQNPSWRLGVKIIFQFLMHSFLRLFLVSLCITFTALPLLLSRIHLITPVALLVNPLLWVPLSTGLLCGLATILSAWFFPPLAYVTGWSASLAFTFLQNMIDLFHQLPGAYYWFPAPPLWWMIGFYVPVLLLTFFPPLRPRRRFLFLGLFLWCMVGWNYGYLRDWERTRADRLEINVLSVGHGTCILMLTPENQTILYDAGCLGRPNTSADILSRALWGMGKNRIDAIILSHPDIDHFNAIPILTERFSIGAVYVSPYMILKEHRAVAYLFATLQQYGIPVHLLQEGDTLAMDSNVQFSILHPPPDREEEDVDSIYSNSTSLVLLVEHRGFRTLFAGDLETKNDSLDVPFLDTSPISCSIILVPHHGGNSNLTQPLLDWTTPQALMISGGRFTYKENVIQQFEQEGYAVFHTMLDGRIQVKIDHSGVELGTFSGKKQEF